VRGISILGLVLLLLVISILMGVAENQYCKANNGTVIYVNGRYGCIFK
jgi:hypothetical protein